MIEFDITFSNGRIQTLVADGYVVDGPWIDFEDRAGLVGLVRAQDVDSITRRSVTDGESATPLSPR